MHFQHQNSLDIFEGILLDHQHEKKFNSDDNLLSSDARLLIGNNWLNLNIIHHFSKLLNKEIDASSKVCMLAELRCWNRSSQLCFFLDIESTEILYCDSLAWSAPKDFPQNIIFFTRLFRLTEHFKVVYGHKKEIPRKKVHRCTEPGCLMIPYQGPNMNICGLETLITPIILTREDKELPRENDWLWTIHRYNSFCRAIFIGWFIKKKINISDLFLSKKVVFFLV